MNAEFDVAIIGSGFAGSLLAMIARRLGRTVVLLEREQHPRFVIGESSTPLANLLLEELAEHYDLPELRPFTKWGTWQRERPDVRCGLKRGFTFYHHTAGQPWTSTAARTNELLVAASPRDDIADTHWYRPEFDHALAKMAVARGATLIERAQIETLAVTDASARVGGQTSDGAFSIAARVILDASGARGFLARALKIAERPYPRLPPTQALYAHFTEVRRWSDLHPPADPPPYPPDDAAIHHVFAGGWIWVLRFQDETVSAGVAATDALAQELRLSDGATAWSRLLERHPSIAEQFASARNTVAFRHLPRLAFRSTAVVGPRWALLPSAAGFVDPLLSTGFPLVLLGVGRLARCLAEDWETSRWPAAMARYETDTLQELDRTAALMAALYRHFDDFSNFAALTQLYFAAASYTETARRLGRPELAGGFLLGGRQPFVQGLERCLERAWGEVDGDATGSERPCSPSLGRTIAATIEPFNVAGLMDPDRCNWYPARAEDLLAAAHKFGPGVDAAAVQAMLRRAGF